METWNTDRGLFQNFVQSIGQSGDGYLWLAYHHGWVSRFDGVRFVHYTPADTPALEASSVHRVFADQQGRLWVSLMGGGLARWSDGGFVRLREGRAPTAGVLEQVFCLLQETPESMTLGSFAGGQSRTLLRGTWQTDARLAWESFPLPNVSLLNYVATDDGRVWFRRGLDRLGFWRDGRCQELPPEQTPGPAINWLVRAPEGSLWVATPRGLFRWREGRFEDMTPTNGPPQVSVTRMEFAGDGSLWVLTPNELRKCRNRAWVATVNTNAFRFNPKSISLRLHGDRNGGVWVVDRHEGVWAVSPEAHAWKLGEADGLPKGLVECWFQDKEGSVWVGLFGAGLARVRPRQFEVVCPSPAGPGQVTSSVCEDASGRMWMGSIEGKVWRQEAGQWIEVTLPGRTVPPREIKLWPGADGEVWIGTVQNGAWTWRDGELREPFPSAAIATEVLAGLTDRTGATWMANGYGLFRFAEGKLHKFGPEDLMIEDRFLALAEDAEGAIWVGTIGGRLWRYRHGRFELFEFPAGTPRFRFWALLPDKDGTLWVGTMGGGLVRWKDGQLSRLSEEHGLPSSTLVQMLDDDDGQLWVGTRHGLFCAFKPDLHVALNGHQASVKCRVFTSADGLPSSEFTGESHPACWKARDGRLWFSTVRGLVSFKPGRLQVSGIIPPVLIEEVRLDGRAWLGGRQSLPRGEAVVPPGKHYLDVAFTATSLASPGQVRFRWRLEGLDTDWVERVNERAVQYSYLPPGRYVFQVTACNSDGAWNSMPASFSFRVQPTLWQTRTFRWGGPVLGGALILAATLGFQRRRHALQIERIRQRSLLDAERARVVEERLEHQRQLEAERVRIASDLHDDLGTSLTQMAWLGEAVNQPDVFAREGQNLLRQIADKSREMVRSIDEIVWALNPRNDSLDQLATYICQFAEEFFRNTPTRCRLDVQDSLPHETLKSEIRHHLFLLCKEVLHNVAKHAQATEVWVRIQFQNAAAVFEFEDNGRGISPGTAAHGDGLDNLTRRAAEIGAILEIRSTPGEGTRVRLRLPLSQTAGQNHPSG